MAVSREVRRWLEKGEFDAVEDAVLAHVAENPTDVESFVGIARALAGTGESERARLLLQLVDGELARAGEAAAEGAPAEEDAEGSSPSRRYDEIRLELLRRAGSLMYPADELHSEILAALERVHGSHGAFEGLVEVVGLHRAPNDTRKTWEKADRLASLTAFDVGTWVWMDGKGAGKVTDTNLELQSFKVDFPRFPGLTVGFRAAPKLLQALAPDHILRAKEEDPESLRRLAAEDPPALLRRVLVSYGRPMKAAEVKNALSGVVEPKKWTSFWNTARKHPQVVSSASGRQSYTWSESEQGALESVWRTFRRAEPRKRIDLLRRDADRDRELADRMAAQLEADAAAAADSDPGLAAEIWYALERADRAPEDVPWTPQRLLARHPADKLFAGIADRGLRERGYELLAEERDDWPSIYLLLAAREEDPRAVAVLAERLREEAPEQFERLLDDVLAQPHRRPAAFVWLAEAAAGDEELAARNPWRLFGHILSAPEREELSPYRSRFRPMVESGGTLPRLLGRLTPEQAPLAQDAVHRTPWLESYEREQLTTALELRFSELRETDEMPLYATPESIEAKREEFQKLVSQELPANRKAIEEARALGDLRENFEYKSARQRHEYLSSLATQMEAELSRVQPIRVTDSGDEIRIGTRVRLAGDGDERTLTILGPWESDPENGVISYQSELGQSLLGKKVGETVTLPDGEREVERVEGWR